MKPATPYTDTVSRRKALRNGIRNALGVNSSAPPSVLDTLHIARDMARLVDLTTGGRYGLAAVQERVVPEPAQLALGELGEALMKDGAAKDAHIERACELLRTPVTLPLPLDETWALERGAQVQQDELRRLARA